LHGCGWKCECNGYLDGDRGAASTDRDDCRVADLDHRGPKRNGDLVFDQRDVLYGERCVERCRGNQRYLERHPKRRRDCELRPSLHWSGRNCEWHGGSERLWELVALSLLGVAAQRRRAASIRS
jgi:hypothetical protein